MVPMQAVAFKGRAPESCWPARWGVQCGVEDRGGRQAALPSRKCWPGSASPGYSSQAPSSVPWGHCHMATQLSVKILKEWLQ